MKKIIRFLPFFFVFTILSCQHHPLDVDVSGVQIPAVAIKRLEKDLFEMNLDSVVALTPSMLKKYGSFYPLFITRIINHGGVRDSSYAYHLKRFLSDKDMRGAYHDCMENYPNLDFLNEALTEAFRHFHYYFPEKNIPQVVSYMSGFNYAVATNDSTLGIGLEMYLGTKNAFYKMIQFPHYKTLTMTKDYLLPDAIKGWLLNSFENVEGNEDFLNEIIDYGKIMYLMDAVLPQMNDTLKIGYTAKQLQWCEKNEANVWTYFVQNKMLYSTDDNEILKFTHEGPFTSAFSKDAPARTGHWMGWQMVRAYMNKNRGITVRQLMEEKDAQKILTQSKYKPRGG